MSKTIKKTIGVKCEKCGNVFDRSIYNPYVNVCRKCRKHKKYDKVVKNKIKDYQLINDGVNNIKIKMCCVNQMKYIINKEYSGMVECKCGLKFRIIGNKIGIGVGLYVMDNNQLVLIKDYRISIFEK